MSKNKKRFGYRRQKLTKEDREFLKSGPKTEKDWNIYMKAIGLAAEPEGEFERKRRQQAGMSPIQINSRLASHKAAGAKKVKWAKKKKY